MSQSVSIFISHSHQDDEFGVRLATDLRRILGDDSAVWYDASGGLHGGDTWWRKIVAELSARPIFIIVLSPDALESPWVADEMNLAWKQKNSPGGKRIIPILYRPCTPWAEVETLQIVSCLPPKTYEQAFAELSTAITQPAPVRASGASQGVGGRGSAAIQGISQGAASSAPSVSPSGMPVYNAGASPFPPYSSPLPRYPSPYQTPGYVYQRQPAKTVRKSGRASTWLVVLAVVVLLWSLFNHYVLTITVIPHTSTILFAIGVMLAIVGVGLKVISRGG